MKTSKYKKRVLQRRCPILDSGFFSIATTCLISIAIQVPISVQNFSRQTILFWKVSYDSIFTTKSIT